MASGPLVGERDAGEKQDKVYSRKNQNKSKNPKSVPRQYYQQQSSLQTLATTIDDNTFSQRQIMPVASDDSSSQPGGQNRREPSHGNAIPGYVKFDNFVKISFNLDNRDEVRALKRKLASELDQVTSLVKRLEATQIQLSKTVNRNAVRMNSEVCSVEPTNPRSFRGSTVSANEHGNNYGVHDESVDKEKGGLKMNQYYKNLDSVVEKKSTPVGGNKKFKSNEMRNGLLLEKDLGRLLKSCRNLLETLMKHKFGWVFNKPVDVKGLGLHDYYKIIRHPMDLGTVKARLSKNLYKSPTEFAEDVRLTFSNAMLYNPKGQDVHIMAEELSKTFEEKWTKIDAEYNFSRRSKLSRNSALLTSTPKKVHAPLAPVHSPVPAAPPAPVHTPAPAPPPRPIETRTLERVESVTMAVDPKTNVTSLAHQGRTSVPKKPKAKDPDKRDMTYEEKQKLSMNLQDLPSDKLDNVVQIIKKRNPVLSQQEDEIEVDIDSFDPETLWELHRFVTNYRKSLSKNKRKAEVAHQAIAEDDNIIQDTVRA